LLHRRAAHAEQIRDFLAERRDPFDHFQGSKTCQAGMIGLADKGRAPVGHDAVADIFIDDPPVGADWLRHG